MAETNKTYIERVAEAVRDATRQSASCECYTHGYADVVVFSAIDLPSIIASVPGAEPVALVNKDGFIVEIHDVAVAPGTKLYTSPQPDPNTRRKVIEECIAHAKSYLDYHAKATAHYSGSCYSAMEYHLNRVNAASNCLDAIRALLNKES